MARYNQLQTTQISSALKRANQRISLLGKTYGRESSVYKQEAGKFLKGAFKDYIRFTDPTTPRGRNVKKAAAGTWKPKEQNIAFDIRAIMKLVREEGSSSKVNRILSEITGIRFDEEGNVKEIRGAGIPTLKQLEKRTTKKLERWGEDPGDYSKKELQGITEQLAEFSENFQTSYEIFFAKFGEAEARKDSTIQLLYGEYRNHRLSYRQLEQIKNRMDEYIEGANKEALAFEEDNTEEL